MPDSLNNGPVEDRSCRDVICCLIFVAFLGGMVIVAILGFVKGNPDLVLYPYDEDGNQCGMANNTLEYKYLYLYQTVDDAKDLNITQLTKGVCVRSCPSNYTGFLDCLPTKQNPKCSVTWKNFYYSTGCKYYINNLFFLTISN